jgi:hypothetical protein
MTAMTHQFVDYIPDALEQGVLYIALEFGAVMHLCADGCGERISTPLHPAQWTLTYDGDAISLSPSVGSGSNCGSHYWIRNGQVRWSQPMTQGQFKRGRERDRADAQRYYKPDTPTGEERETHDGWLERMLQRLRHLIR